MRNLFNYIDRPSPVHQLTGATKLVCLLALSFGCMCTFDTRYLAGMVIFSLVMFRVSNIQLRDVSFVLSFTMYVMTLNIILIYLFSPQHGQEIYGSATPVFAGLTGKYAPTWETLFYLLNYLLKYLATIPIVLLFITTTNPSEFAASLNKLGVKYSIAYSVALALRYIPDIQREYHEISQAQQARGIEMSKKAPVIQRIKGAAAILVPLVLSSMDRIDVISNAMELRGFGKNKKRTWYMGRPFTGADIGSMVFALAMMALALLLNKLNGGRFFNPFL